MMMFFRTPNSNKMASPSLQTTKGNDWSNWRGPLHNGTTVATNLPTKFTNIEWSTDLMGPSHATPIVHGKYVFTTVANVKQGVLQVVALDRKTGKVLWADNLGTGHRSGNEGSVTQLDERSIYAAPSPTTDGKHVWFFFGNGDLGCYSVDGKKIWSRNIQKDTHDFNFMWTFSSSPLLYKGILYLQILQRDKIVGRRGKDGGESYLLAMDPKTGQDLWKASRPSEASNESRESYGTPMPYTSGGRDQLLVAGGDYLSGHDPKNGKELWRWGTWNPGHRELWWRLVPSPVAGDGVVLVCAPKKSPVFACPTDKQGDISASGLLWKSDDRSNVTSDVATPAFHDGKFFVVSDVRKSVSCVEAKTGKIVWSTDTPGFNMCWGSPTIADGKLYTTNVGGIVLVYDIVTGKLLADNRVDEEGSEVRSSVAIAGNQLFIRTSKRMMCIASPTRK